MARPKRRSSASGRRSPVSAPAIIRRPQPIVYAGVAAAVVASAIVRLVAARGDLWLDEIWTLQLLSEWRSPLQAFRFPHDTNHILNSLVLWPLQQFDVDWVYRLPATVAGSGAVLIAAWIAAMGEDDAEQAPDAAPELRALVTAVVLGSSFLMIHYGSEARGYPFALALGLLALAAARRGLFAPRSRWTFAYGPALALAMLGHALAVHVLTGALVWSLVRWRRRRLSWRETAIASLWWHAIPVAAGMALYVGVLRELRVGGGPTEGIAPVLARTVAYAGGLPLSFGSFLLCALGLAVILAAAIWMHRRGADAWGFYLTAALLSPVVVRAVQPGEENFERYFLLNAALGLMLFARLVAALATQGRGGRVAMVAVLGVFAVAQSPRVERLLREERGQYRDAVRLMLDTSPGPEITVSGDHDFRNSLVVHHYAARLPGGHRIVYLRNGSWTGTGPQWLLFHRFEAEPNPGEQIGDREGNRYRLERIFPSGPLSGWRWLLYRRTSG